MTTSHKGWQVLGGKEDALLPVLMSCRRGWVTKAEILSPTLESMSQVLQSSITFSGIVSISDMRYQKTTLLEADTAE